MNRHDFRADRLQSPAIIASRMTAIELLYQQLEVFDRNHSRSSIQSIVLTT